MRNTQDLVNIFLRDIAVDDVSQPGKRAHMQHYFAVEIGQYSMK